LKGFEDEEESKTGKVQGFVQAGQSVKETGRQEVFVSEKSFHESD
jgi:hypothetical protein